MMPVCRKIFSCLSAALVAVLFSFSAFAESVFVAPLGEGDDASLRAAVYSLVRAAVSNEAGYSLASNAKDAQLQLAPHLLKLGSSYIVTVDKLKGERVLFTAKMKAATVDDLDTVSARVVRAALAETKAEATAQVDDVTEHEVTQGTRRQQATRQWKFGFGPAWGSNLNTNKSGLVYALGFVWGIDSDWDVDIAFRGSGFDDTGAFTEFLIGSNYYLTRGKYAPFVTAGVGRGSAVVSKANSSLFNPSDDIASGWMARVGAGYKFFRTSNVNVGIEANYSTLFATTSRTGNTPGVTTLLLSVYY